MPIYLSVFVGGHQEARGDEDDEQRDDENHHEAED